MKFVGSVANRTDVNASDIDMSLQARGHINMCEEEDGDRKNDMVRQRIFDCHGSAWFRMDLHGFRLVCHG